MSRKALKAPFIYFGKHMEEMEISAETVRRFWAKVDKTEGCWLWTASTRSKGYGALGYTTISGKIINGRAHRFSWELVHGPVPDGLCVLHKCDTPACVRPSHLFLGTKADNNRDMHTKGRSVPGGTYTSGRYKRGEQHWGSKLTAKVVRALRKTRERTGMSYTKLGKKYGIGLATVWQIINHKTWKHIDE